MKKILRKIANFFDYDYNKINIVEKGLYKGEKLKEKLSYKNLIRTKRCYNRCVIITGSITGSKKIETQIRDFLELGFKNIIVQQDNSKKSMYNIENYRNYLQDNKDSLIKCINEENIDSKAIDVNDWKYEIQHDDNIFYHTNLLLTNFLKWCCNK